MPAGSPLARYLLRPSGTLRWPATRQETSGWEARLRSTGPAEDCRTFLTNRRYGLGLGHQFRWRLVAGQHNDKFGPALRSTTGRDSSSMSFDDGTANCQSQADATTPV